MDIKPKFENPEVIYSSETILEFNDAWIKLLKVQAMKSSRKTSRLCLHRNKNSTLHQMLIMHNRTTKVPIHKHLHSDLYLHILSGKATLKVYTPRGELSKTNKLGDEGFIYFRVPKETFYTINIISEWFLFKEMITGPFREKNNIKFHDL